jgi:hypothetical protein
MSRTPTGRSTRHRARYIVPMNPGKSRRRLSPEAEATRRDARAALIEMRLDRTGDVEETALEAALEHQDYLDRHTDNSDKSDKP